MTLPVSNHYREHRGRDYQVHLGRSSFYRRYQVELYFRHHVRPTDTVLDFGCNDGLFLSLLDAHRRIGVEVNPAAREQCAWPDIELHGDIGEIADGVADVAISNHCLEHTLAPYESLCQIRRVLKPGGKLVLVLPFDDWRSPFHRVWRANDPNNHLFTWSPMNIGNLLTEAGFRVDSTRHMRVAVSNRFEPIRTRFGDRALRLAAALLSRYRRGGEVLAIAFKPPAAPPSAGS